MKALAPSQIESLVREPKARLRDRAVIGLAGSAALLSWAAWRQSRREPGSSPRSDEALGPAPPEPPGDPKPPADPEATKVAIGYVFVARDAPRGDSARHAHVISEQSAALGMKMMTTVRDVETAPGDGRHRPALRWAIEQIAGGTADALIVAELQQLAKTAACLPPVLGWFTDHNKALMAVDVQLDTSTEPGRLAARAIAHVGRWEHERISAATRRGLEAARDGAAAGRRASVADVPELRDRIVSLRASGMTLKGIADLLNEEGVPTVRGGARWRPSSVQAVTGYRRPSVNDRRAELPRVMHNGTRPADDAG